MLSPAAGKYRLSKSEAQSTLEYAVVIACVVAALLGMQFYLRRGIQGRIRAASDEIGEQYTPLNVDSTITTEIDSTTKIKQSLVPLSKGGKPILDSFGLPVYGIKTEVDMDETTKKSGSEKLGEFEDGLF